MNKLSQSAIMEESEVREAKKWRRASALWFPTIGSHTQNGGRVNKRNINRGGAIPEPASGFLNNKPVYLNLTPSDYYSKSAIS